MTFPIYQTGKSYLEHAKNTSLTEEQRRASLYFTLRCFVDSIKNNEQCVDAAREITQISLEKPEDPVINKFLVELKSFITEKKNEGTSYAQHALRILAIELIKNCRFEPAVENLSILFSSCRNDLDLMMLHYVYNNHPSSQCFFKPVIKAEVEKLSLVMGDSVKLQLSKKLYVESVVEAFFYGYCEQHFTTFQQKGIARYKQQIALQEDLVSEKPGFAYFSVWMIYHQLGLYYASSIDIADKIIAYTFYELPSLYNYPIAKQSASKLFNKNPLPDTEQFEPTVANQQAQLNSLSVNSPLPGEWAYIQGVYEFKKTNYQEAKNYFLYASKQGYLAADLWLSVQYGAKCLRLPNDTVPNSHDAKLAAANRHWFRENFRPNYICIFNLYLLGEISLDKASKHFSFWAYGFLYQHGFGGANVNVIEAFGFFTKASNFQSIEAWYALGWMHELGIGCAPNQEEANKCFTKAANANLAEAQNKLGDNQMKLGREMYQNQPNDASASTSFFKCADDWYLRAFNQGFAQARFTYYRRRHTLFYDYSAEISKAANQSLTAAEVFVAKYYREIRYRDDIDIKDINIKLSEPRRLEFAREFYYTRNAAEKNRADSQYRLAYLYYSANIDQEGNILPDELSIQSKRKATKQLGQEWMRKAAEGGDRAAQACLGQVYYHSDKYDTAYFWLQLSMSEFSWIDSEGRKKIKEMLEDIEKKLSIVMGDAEFKNFKATMLYHLNKDENKKEVEKLLQEAAKGDNLAVRANLSHVRGGLPVSGIGSIQDPYNEDGSL